MEKHFLPDTGAAIDFSNLTQQAERPAFGVTS
jgi:hypothetical protein